MSKPDFSEFSGLDYNPEEEDVEIDLESMEEEEVEDKEVQDEPETEDEPEAEDQPEPEPAAEPEKKVQTPEENAMFAERRREQQFQQRFQQEVAKTPEHQLATMMAQHYGVPVEQLMATLKEAQLEKESKATNIPIELLREREAEKQRTEQLTYEVNQLKFERWFDNVKAEKQQLLTEYPMLSAEEIDAATNYVLETLKRTDIPIKQGVLALYGEKIISSLQTQSKTEALAEISGRAKGALPPQGGSKANVETLTEEERSVAAAMGISEKDYLKYRSKTSL